MNSILYRYTFELVTNDFIFFEMFLVQFLFFRWIVSLDGWSDRTYLISSHVSNKCSIKDHEIGDS